MPIAITAVFILMDVVSGVLKAIKNKELSSEKARDGVFHKAAYALIISCAIGVEWGMAYMDIGFTVPIVVPACALIVLGEILSIIENASELNPELKGTKLLALFSHVKDE